MKYDKLLRNNWNFFAERDAIHAIITNFTGTKKDFFQCGVDEVNHIMEKKVSIDTISEYEKSFAVDFGCGIGRLTKPLSNHFDVVAGIDISEKMLELAGEDASARNIQYLERENSDKLPIASNCVDFILSLQVLQHIPRFYKNNIFKEFYRILRTKGKVYFEHPYSGKESIHKKHVMHMDVWGINKLGDTLTEIGFKVLNIESLGHKDLWPRAAYTLVK